jgi:hypothetical protein
MADYAISNVARRVVYTNTGVGPYSFTFEILANTDIAVYRGSTLLTLTTDYSVTINANGTGSVTLVVSGTGNITLVGARAIQRTSDYTTGGDLFASTLNTDLDSQTIYAQQVAETAERALKAPVTDPTDIAMTLPAKASRAGKVLSFDGTTGNPIASITATDVANAQTYANNASASASAASSSASSASGSASAASSSATAAAASAAAAATKVAKTSDTGAAIIPAGTTGQRDAAPVNGYFRYNSSLASFEGYVGGSWGGVGGAQAGGVIFENALTISANYTLTTSKNGLSVGPITINSGVTVTVPSGQRWVIL